MIGSFVPEKPLFVQLTKSTSKQSVLPEACSSFFFLFQNFYQTEHLLLKVTYHPFWKCAFHSSSDATDQARDWHEIPVHHVTPNLMTVVLPPGRHHVTCQYKNPIYQKVGFVLFFMIFIALLMKELANLVQSTCYKSLFIVV